MTLLSRVATSDCASTASIGGVIPISIRELVSRSDSRARSSDCCCTTREALEYARSQYAFRTARAVCATICCTWISDWSRLFSARMTCCLRLSIRKLRRSGCWTLRDSDDCSCGEKLEKRFVVVDRELSHPI